MATDSSYVQHLDRRFTRSTPGVSVTYDSGTNLSTITAPYELSGGETMGMCDTTNFLRLVLTQTSSTTYTVLGDWRSNPFIMGTFYPIQYRLSRQFMRGEKGGSEQRGRLQLRYLNFDLVHTTDMTVVVTSDGRAPVTYVYSDPTAAETATWRIAVMARNTTVTIDVTDSTPGATRIAAWDWEGEYVLRSRPA